MYEIPPQSGLGLRAGGNLFTVKLHTEVEVTNDTEHPLTIDAGGFSLLDTDGKSLASKPAHPPACGEPPRGLVAALPPGGTCRFQHRFKVNPDGAAIWVTRNPALREVTLEFPVARGDGSSFSVRIPLAWTH
jgi:hypothetical protein